MDDLYRCTPCVGGSLSLGQQKLFGRVMKSPTGQWANLIASNAFQVRSNTEGLKYTINTRALNALKLSNMQFAILTWLHRYQLRYVHVPRYQMRCQTIVVPHLSYPEARPRTFSQVDSYNPPYHDSYIYIHIYTYMSFRVPSKQTTCQILSILRIRHGCLTRIACYAAP